MTQNEFSAKLIILGFKQTSKNYLSHPDLFHLVVIRFGFIQYGYEQYTKDSEELTKLYTILVEQLHKK